MKNQGTELFYAINIAASAVIALYQFGSRLERFKVFS